MHNLIPPQAVWSTVIPMEVIPAPRSRRMGEWGVGNFVSKGSMWYDLPPVVEWPYNHCRLTIIMDIIFLIGIIHNAIKS